MEPSCQKIGFAEDAQEKGIEIDTFTQELAGVDRAILEGETDGFVKVHVKKGTDKIVGGTVVASNAGDIVSEITMATISSASTSSSV